MPLNTNQLAFLERLSREEIKPVSLLEVNLHRLRNGMHETDIHRPSTRPFQSLASDSPAFEEWVGQIRQTSSRERNVFDALIGRGASAMGTTTSGSMTLDNDDHELDDLYGPPVLIGSEQKGGYSPSGQTITEYLMGQDGGLSYANKIEIASVIGSEVVLDDESCTISWQSGLQFLDRTIFTETFSKADFPNLPDDLVGSPKAEAWGPVFNVEPILVDPVEDLWFLACRGRDILALRAGGLPVDINSWEQINDNRGLLVRILIAAPQGFKFTADIEGSQLLDESWSAQYGDIVGDWFDRYASDATIRAEGLAQLKTARPYDMGIYFKAPTRLRDALILLSAGMHAFFVEDSLGEINMGALELPPVAPPATPDLTIADDVALPSPTAFTSRNVPPIYGIRIEYAQLETRQDEGQLSQLFQNDESQYKQLLPYYKNGHRELPLNEDAADLENDPSAVLGPYKTRIVTEAHAQAYKNQIKALRGETTSHVTTVADANAHALHIHDIVRIERAHMNLKNGKDYRVLGIRPSGATVGLILWG